MEKFKFIGKPRARSWRANNPELFDVGTQMFLSGADIPDVIDYTGMPRTGAQRLKARITKWKNEKKRLEAAASRNYVLHAALAIFPRATGFFTWKDAPRQGMAL